MKIGIDIGGMSAKIGLVDGKNVVRKARIPTGADISFEKLIEDICRTVIQLVGSDSFDFAGVSSCGLIDCTKGSVVYSNNIRWENKTFADTLQSMLGVKTGIANDAKCAALAEAVYGAGKDCNRMCMLTIGTGVGGGFVHNKELESGDRYADASAVLGHITVERGGRLCTCGRRGCLEAYASASAVMASYKQRTGRDATAEQIFKAARTGEKNAADTVEEFVMYLSEGITDIVNVYRPQTVVIGGGVSDSADMFLAAIENKVNQEIYGGKFLPVSVRVAELGNDAGMIGATLLSPFAE